MAGEMLRSNLKAIYLLVFIKLVRHSGVHFWQIPLNEDDWESFYDHVSFFDQFKTSKSALRRCMLIFNTWMFHLSLKSNKILNN